MSNPILPLRLTILLISALSTSVLHGETEPNREKTYEAAVVPFLKTHCYDCHRDKDAEGGLRLDGWQDAPAAVADRAAWLRIRRALARQEMPPADQKQPASEETAKVVAWIDAAVLGIDCSQPQPGKVTIRRLNREEYRNTIRDLLGVQVSVSEFPVDPSGHGFDNLGDVLTIPPLLIERYLAAAEAALDEALETPEDRQAKTRRYSLELLETGYNAKPLGNGYLALTSGEEDDVVALHRAPAAGEYTLAVQAYARQKGEYPMELTFLLGDEAVETVKVVKDMPAIYSVKLQAPRGTQRFRVAVRRIKDGLSPKEAAEWKKGPPQNGTIYLEWLEVSGPHAATAELPASHQRLFAAAGDRSDPRAAAIRVLSPFVDHAYRRPVRAEEIERLVDLAQASWNRGASFELGVKTALTAALVSPRFLYRAEITPEAAAQGTVAPLDEFALASRLSYFLWSSLPDEELFQAARENRLRANLPAQIKRMLADPKAEALVRNFAGQWLELRNLELAAPDPTLFPAYDQALRDAMRRETELLFETIRREDRPLLELLSADYTFVNERLAKHYGLSDIKGSEFQRVSLVDSPRRGLLGHGSILTITSNPTRTSPVKRGKWILENLLAAPPPPPPANVPELDTAKNIDPTLPLRKRLEQHRANPVCASCHQRMDSLGFALEHFDAVGRWREKDGTADIDSTGKLFVDQQFGGAADLVKILAGPEQERFLRCTAEKMLTYALGRGLEPYDTCALDQIVARLKAREGRFSALVEAIVDSVPFGYVQLNAK